MSIYDYITFTDIITSKTDWLWYPYIPKGKVTIIMGDSGEGKTTLALNIAASVSNGKPFWGGEDRVPADVIYQTAEDGLSDTIKPRLEAANADCSRIHTINELDRGFELTDERLPDVIQELGAELVIIDPIQAFLGPKVDMNRANEIRPYMSYLAGIANQYNCAVVLIGHLNKNTGAKAAYRAIGSIDITAAARSVLIVAKDKGAPENRVVAHIKSSLAPQGKTVAFELGDNSGFAYKGEYKADIDDLLLGIASGREKVSDRAREMILKFMPDSESEVPAAQVIEAAANEGISPDTLGCVKRAMGIGSKKRDGVWYWRYNSKNERLKE